MRNLALILLLANLMLLAWQYWIRAPEPSQPRVMPGVPVLQVVREVPGRQAAPAAGDPSAALSSDRAPADGAAPGDGGILDAPRCVSLGPFSGLAAASAAAERLREDGLTSRQRAAEGQEWFGYWVQLVFDQREEAAAAVQRLRDGGVDDAYLIPGDGSYTVSLGVFSTRARAFVLRDQVRALDEDPLIRDRFREGTVYWLDMVLPVDAPPNLPVPTVEGPAPQLQPALCPAEVLAEEPAEEPAN